ncbi:hypothetical protein [uncultured Bacteroides sp.]|uniref:hypothetical protein n=1 Tax=uncultured Bacteroides sp. TaxID=162156 RepID=UPI0025D19D65|nr:hypothetical protein [uncultured Bacteroides sp.]
MKKILFILFTVQFVLAPHIMKSYSVDSIEDSYEYSIVNQGKKTVKKDIWDNTIIEDDNLFSGALKGFEKFNVSCFFEVWQYYY